MIEGLKLVFQGTQMIAVIEARIARHRVDAAEMRDALEAAMPASTDAPYAGVDANILEQEIRRQEYRISLLTTIREHIIPEEVYLLGKDDLGFDEMMPDPPDPDRVPDRLVERPVRRPIAFKS